MLGTRWDELDLDGAIWTIPGERMKSKRPHRVPLSTKAVVLLKRLPQVEGSPHVFPGSRRASHLSPMTMTAVLRRMGRGDITAHGFRNAFRDWVAEGTSYPRELAEAALAHVLKNKAEAAYQRGDLLERRRKMMQAWAEYLDRTKADGKIIAMQERASR